MAQQVVEAAVNSAGPNVKELDETGSKEPDSEGFFVKEFFWDKIVIVLSTTIIGLTAVDVLTEVLRGGNGVVCFLPEDLNFTEEQAEYVSGFCSRNAPDAQYVPFFVLIHGVVIAAWHYIWRSSYSAQFDFFFSTTSHLERFRDKVTGEYPLKNIRIINRLETEFCTYRKHWIVWWYRIKLVCQCFTAIGSLLISFLWLNNFNVDFTCQWKDPTDQTTADIQCIFAALRLFSWVQIVDAILLGLIILALIVAFLWTFVRHTDALSSKSAAKFSFCGGMNSKYYQPESLFSLRFLTQLFSPRIKTDFDFLLLALYKTDSGLAHILTEGLVHLEKTKLVDTEIRYLTNNEFIDESADEDLEGVKNIAPNWIVPTEAKTDFETVKPQQALQLPCDIAGAVMGFGLCASENMFAMDVSFGSLGFSPALARVFIQAASINFDPDYKDTEDVVKKFTPPNNLTGVRCHHDVFSLGADKRNQFTGMLKEEFWDDDFTIDYMVIGPIDSKDQLSTVTQLITSVQLYFSEGAILLTVTPTRIEGKTTDFLRYKPPTDKPKLFSKLSHSVKVADGRLPWPPATPQCAPQPATSFPLKCGTVACSFDLELYKFEKPQEGPYGQPEATNKGAVEDLGIQEERSKEGDKEQLLPKKKLNTEEHVVYLETATTNV